MKFLTIRRFNFIDLTAIGIFTGMIREGHWVFALLAIFGLSIVSTLVEQHVGDQLEKD